MVAFYRNAIISDGDDEVAVTIANVTMKQITALLFFCLLLAIVGCTPPSPSTGNTRTFTPTATDSPMLLPVKVAGKWGYVSEKGQLVINPQFDHAEYFSEGRAVVCIGKPCEWFAKPGESRYGYIDTTGRMIVTPQYQEASSFSEGLASVCVGDGCGASDKFASQSRGYIDRDGKLVIPTQFGVATDFHEGLAQVCIGKCDWTEGTGYNGKFGFIDHSGHFIINPIYDNAGDFKNGFASVTVGKGDDAKTGYVDKAGKIIWPPSN